MAGTAIVAAGLLAYRDSLGSPFVFDDPPSIAENPTLRHLWPVWAALRPPQGGGITVESRPILNFSLAVNHAVSGTEVWSYHAQNLLIHLLAGLTLFAIVRSTLAKGPPARREFGPIDPGIRRPGRRSPSRFCGRSIRSRPNR